MTTPGWPPLPPEREGRGSIPRSVPRVTPEYRAGSTRKRPATPEPGSRPRRKRPRLRRALKRTALVLSVLLLLVSGVGAILVAHYNGNIDRISVLGRSLTHVKKPPPAPHGAENFLLVGSDTRAGANSGPDTGTEALAGGQRSDTIILAHLYGRSDKAVMVSFPRDSWVQIPAWDDPKTHRHHPAHEAKINSAMAEGGPALLVATIEQLTGIRVDHYLQVDFVGFKSMVDHLGGVDVCLPKAAHDSFSGLVLSAGRHHIDGRVALAFVRQRHGLPQGDIDRIKRQQQMLGSLAHKVLSAGTLLNPLRLNGFLDAATKSLKADETMSFGDFKDLALRARRFQSAGVLFVTVPVANSNGRRGGQSVVLLDDQGAASLFDALRHDRLPGAAPAPTPSHGPAVVPASVRVRVVNGSGVNGLGRKALAALAAKGFATVGPAGTRSGHATGTVVRYGPGQQQQAQAVAAALPGASTALDPSLTTTVEVVVGSSYGAPTPAPKPVASVPVRTAQQDPCS